MSLPIVTCKSFFKKTRNTSKLTCERSLVRRTLSGDPRIQWRADAFYQLYRSSNVFNLSAPQPSVRCRALMTRTILPVNRHRPEKSKPSSFPRGVPDTRIRQTCQVCLRSFHMKLSTLQLAFPKSLHQIPILQRRCASNVTAAITATHA